MPRQITVTGGSLFRVAAEQIGDANAAWLIAQANGLSDFWLTGAATLTIPDVTEDQINGGVPA